MRLKHKLALLCFIFTAMILSQNVFAQSPVDFSVRVQGQDTVVADQLFDMNISVCDSVYSDNNISAFDFIVRYDPNVLQYNYYTMNDTVTSAVYSSVYSSVYLSKNEAYVKFTIGFIGEKNAIDYNGDILKLNFSAKQITKMTTISIPYILAATGEGELYMPRTVSKTISIRSRYDVNADGAVNLKDLSIVAFNAGKDINRFRHCDVNSDGVIDRRDVNEIMAQITSGF